MTQRYDALARIFAYTNESDDERQKRGILILLVGFTCLAGLGYSLIYVLLGVAEAITAIQIYIGMSLVNVLLFYITKNYNIFRNIQLIGICIFPTLTHVLNGGFEQSSGVVLAAMLSPLGALMFHTPKAARLFFVIFLMMVLVAVFVDLYVDIPRMELPKEVRMLFYFFNIATITAISFFLLLSFVSENERYKKLLKQQNEALIQEKQRSDELLLNILPMEVAEELKSKGHADAQLIDFATVLFTDFKGFTQLSEKLTPRELVSEINTCFSEFDRICDKYHIEKIKTIGDSYMAAGGLPSPNKTHASDVVKAALDIQKFMLAHKAKKEKAGELFFEIRIGIHTGPVVAGIVGIRKFQYDIWGDTVNTASRMESSGEAGKVNISGTTYEQVQYLFNCVHRGKISAKGKGEIDMYFVEA